MNLRDLNLWEKGQLKGFALPLGFLPEIGETVNILEPFKRLFIVEEIEKDGEIAEKLTHPSYDKKKIYQVTLDKDLTQEDYEKIKSGVLLSDGEIAADELEYVEDDNHKKIGIEIHSGKNRIVRRIFESLGYEVRGLDRVYFAGLTKKGLKRGQWRFLTQGEENILKIGAYN